MQHHTKDFPNVESPIVSAEQEAVVQEDILAQGGEMGALMRSCDWSQTPIGPVKSWSQSLKTAVRIVLGSRYIPPQNFENHPVVNVLLSGNAKFVPVVTDGWMQSAATSPEHLQFMRDCELRSPLHSGRFGTSRRTGTASSISVG